MYKIRRGGQVVGTYEKIIDAFEDRQKGDQVFRIIETFGEFGCITEREVVRHGAWYAYKIEVPVFSSYKNLTMRGMSKFEYIPLTET